MRRKRKKIAVLSLGLLLMFIIFSNRKIFSDSLYETISSLVCDEKRGKVVLRELCTSYNNGEVTGNLCADLCGKLQLVTIEQCLSHKNDNVIFAAKWRNQDIILKAKKLSDYYSWEDVFPDSSNEDIAELQKSFVAVVFDHVTSQLVQDKSIKTNFTLDRLSPERLLAQLYFNVSVTSLSKNEMQSIWLLLQQDEYFLMQLLRDLKHIPRIYGTCGQFYALEKVKTLVEFVGVGLISAPVTWRVRVKLALDMLDLVRELDTKTVYGRGWQHCDIQPSNFGVDHRGTIKAIDVDLVYTNDKILEVLDQQAGNCSSHKDCEFFDCASLCDVEGRKKCTSVKISNNLQVVCRDLFKSEWFESGLLTSIPAQSKTKLNRILGECATATTIPWTKRKYNKVFNTLSRYLSEERLKE